jgi:hypothetical protein
MTGRTVFCVLGLLGLTACGGPSTPSIFTPPAESSTASLSGTLVKYGTSTPVAGATLIAGGRIASTDAQGRFSLTSLPASGVAAVTIGPAGFLFRSVPFTLAATRAGLTIDLIEDAPPFSLPFYRALVRNGYESTVLAVTSAWTMSPNFYVNMQVVGTSGQRMTDAIVDEMQRVVTASIPELSGGRIHVGAFERGDIVREQLPGWVNITFFDQLDVFGRSSVGGNSGSMQIRSFLLSGSNSNTNPNNCFSPEVQVIDHEITHTMGFWHTPDALVDTLSGPGCPGSNRPDYVKYHAALMYSRPPGNRDPDIDPSDAVRSLAPVSAMPPEVSCPASFFIRR